MCNRLPGAVPVTVADQLAGFLVQDTARLRFIATDRRFAVLDGSRFARPMDAQRAADRVARLVLPDAEHWCLRPTTDRAASTLLEA